MIDFYWPWALALIVLPIIVRWLAKPVSSSADALRLPIYTTLRSLSSAQNTQSASHWMPMLLLWLLWSSLVVALARPHWVGDPLPLPVNKRDMLLAVDISRSMAEGDMLIGQQYTTRIDAVKGVVSDFVKNRTSDRLGLILFGEQAFLQTPLTFDRKTVGTQLLEAQLGFAGNATAIGDAIGVAIKRLRDRPAQSRVLILLTDGANTAGTNPKDAAIVADEAGIRIHTIGIGATSKQERDFFGRVRTVNPSADLDETTLRFIAKRTGGQYFRAQDPQELKAVYKTLDELEPSPQEQIFRPTKSILHWPLSFAFFVLLLITFVSRRFAQ